MSYCSLIAGEWMKGTEEVPNINPSNTTDVIGESSHADGKQARHAIDAARSAFPAWAATTIQARSEILERVGAELFARREELGDLLAREEGKTLAEGIGEATRAAQLFKFYAGEALRIVGERFDSIRPGVEIEVTREPLGVVGIIAPWNFPLAIPAWKIAPALVYGNTVVFKPAELVPGCAWALTDILHRAGIPAGVFNLVLGRGKVVGNAFIESPHVDVISFTGSVETGRSVLAKGAARQKKVQLELGGKSPMIVLDDADLDVAVRVCLDGAFLQAGQRCTASSRLIIQRGIKARFVSALKDAVEALVVDDARKPGTTIGPVVDERQLVQDERYIQLGTSEGGKLVTGGTRVQRETPGFFFSPALFDETSNAMRINREEVFGPVACIIPVDSYEEAVAVANDSEFGLSSGICTTSLKYAAHFKRASASGMVMVNLPTAGVDYHAPFGGRKASSYGSREQGRAAIEFYTTTKTAYTLPC